MCDFLEKYIKFPKWSCVLKFFSEHPGVFVPDAEMNDEDDAYILFIRLHRYKNTSYCSLHKQLLPEHIKTCPSCTNIENLDKRKVTTWKILVLKSCSILDFHSEY